MACDNTLLIAERANVEIEFGKPQLPSFPLPEGFASDSRVPRAPHLRGCACSDGGTRCPTRSTERLAFELRVIADMGFSSYFLIVWDLIRHARESGIRVGPGRGSAAGCAVAYCLRITDLDPIQYDLLFERFLNPSRISMPDIDMDFDSRYRDEMIRYAAERYGRDRVAQIITFSTIKARAAVRDAARVLGYPYAIGDKVAKLMPPLIMGRDTPLKACLDVTSGHEDGYKMASDLRALYATDSDCKRVIDVAKGLEGHAPPGRHPRRRGGDHEGAAHRVPADPAQARSWSGSRGSASRDAVRDARRRRPRPAEDGLPRVAQPRRAHGHRRDHPHHAWRRPRHRRRGARRPTDLRVAAAGGLDRCVPTRGRADAGADALARTHDVRRRRRARGPVPARADGGEHAQRLRRSQERPEAHPVPASRCRRGAGRHVRPDDLPRELDARRAEVRGLLARRGGQPASAPAARRSVRR